MKNTNNVQLRKQHNEAHFSLVESGSPIASLYLRKIRNGFFRLIDIHVKEEYRRMGYGSHLFQETIQHLKQEEGHGVIYLEYGNWMSSDAFAFFIKKMAPTELHYEYSTIILPMVQLKDSVTRIPYYSNSLLHVKSFSSLSSEECTALKKAQQMAPKYLAPQSKNQIQELSFSVFDYDGCCLGWLIAEQKKRIIRLMASYNSCSSPGIGLLLWNVALQHIDNELLEKAQWLSFDFDKTNERLNRLYMKVLDGLYYKLYDTYSRSIPF